jgi:hypothetical protein
MSSRTKKSLLEAVVSTVLPQQVPDAEVMTMTALASLGLATAGQFRPPDVIARSVEHQALFFIVLGPIDEVRLDELNGLSDTVPLRRVFVSVFDSRKDYAEKMDDQAVNTFLWFADEPRHHLFISGSPSASAEFLSARFASK